MVDNRLIVALDFHDIEDVVKLVEKLDDSVNFYKVGMELFYSVGPSVITYLKSQDKKIFLDLKLHDIPNTVAQGLASLMALGPDFMTVHASGGSATMKTAAERVHAVAKERGIKRPKLLAVTILTSISEETWNSFGVPYPIRDTVLRLAKLAKEAGMDGVVASPKEAADIRAACGEDFLIVTPGVRPVGSDANDQSRIATPAAALQNGATHLVVGRPIRKAENPRKAAEDIIREMEAVK